MLMLSLLAISVVIVLVLVTIAGVKGFFSGAAAEFKRLMHLFGATLKRLFGRKASE